MCHNCLSYSTKVFNLKLNLPGNLSLAKGKIAKCVLLTGLQGLKGNGSKSNLMVYVQKEGFGGVHCRN